MKHEKISALLKAFAALYLLMIPALAGAYETISSGQTAKVNVVYEFTAPSSGLLEITTPNYYIQYDAIFFSSPAHTLESVIKPYNTIFTDSGYAYYFVVTEGQKYYFYLDYASAGGVSPTFVFKMLEGGLPNEIASVNPMPSTAVAYNLSSAPNLEIIFLRSGTFSGNASIEFTTVEGGKDSTRLDYEQVIKGNITSYEFNVREAITRVKPQMKDKSNFTVVIADPKIDGEAVSGQYVDDATGSIELTYRYEAATTIASVVYPNPFLSFFTPDDPDGVMIFTFDAPLAAQSRQTNAALKILAGPYVDGGEDMGGWPELPGAPMEFSGNVLRVDLRNVVRETNFDMVTVRISGVIDANGQAIDYYGSEMIELSNIPYELIKNSGLVYELTPAAGSLEGVGSLELYMDAGSFKVVEVEGFRFEADGVAPVVISLAETNPTENSLDPGSMIYTVPVPQAIQAAPNVTFTAVLKSLNGYEYSLSASYNLAEDGVEGINKDERDAVWFDLHGRRVASPSKGIYIQKGKKVRTTGFAR